LISTAAVNCKTPAINRHIEKQMPGADLEQYRTVLQKQAKEFQKHGPGAIKSR
jgi:hypothetical protein